MKALAFEVTRHVIIRPNDDHDDHDDVQPTFFYLFFSRLQAVLEKTFPTKLKDARSLMQLMMSFFARWVIAHAVGPPIPLRKRMDSQRARERLLWRHS